MVGGTEDRLEHHMNKEQGEAMDAQFWVSDGTDEAEAIKLLESRDFLIHKRYCGRAVVVPATSEDSSTSSRTRL